MATGIFVGTGNTNKATEIYVGTNGIKKAKKVYIGIGGTAKKIWPLSGKDLFDAGKDYGTVGINMHTMRWRNSNSSGTGSNSWRLSKDSTRRYVNDNTMQLDFLANQGTLPNYTGSGMASTYAIYIAWCWSENSSIAVPDWVIDGLNQYHYTLSCQTSLKSTDAQSVTLYNSTLRKYVACVRINFDDRCNYNTSKWNTPTISWT